MPSPARVKAFVECVSSQRYVEALEQFYTDDATMQDNDAPPRGGLATLVAHERATLARLKEMRTKSVGAILVDGDMVAINWVFEMTLPNGARRRMDELALQHWRGDRIQKERFYYDPAQLAKDL